MGKKQVIKLNEGDLHRIIKESVKNVLNKHGDIKESVNRSIIKENDNIVNHWDYNSLGVWSLMDEIVEFLGAEKVLSTVLGNIPPYDAFRILKQIKDLEVSPYLDESDDFDEK